MHESTHKRCIIFFILQCSDHTQDNFNVMVYVFRQKREGHVP